MTDSSFLVFSPIGGRVECAAFSRPFKVIAVALVTLAVAWAWRMWTDGLLLPTLESSGWLLAALLLMLVTEWHILRGKTVLDASSLHQSWVWEKRVVLKDLAYAKLIRLRGLEWLVAPRLYTKTYSGKLAVFYASEPAMLAEFERLEQRIKDMRGQI